MISHMERRERARSEITLLREYHAQLLAAGVSLPWEACRAEYAAGGSERWVWLLAILASSCPAPMVLFWAEQLDSFCEDWGVCEDNIGMPRV